jgi:hypothetical protein
VPRVKIEMDGYRCVRCGHEWIPRKDDHPRVCPKCKSPFWDRERWLAWFRVEGTIEGSPLSATQLQRLERRLGESRRPTVRRSGNQVRVDFDVQAATEGNARLNAKGFLRAAAAAIGLRNSEVEIRSAKRRAD